MPGRCSRSSAREPVESVKMGSGVERKIVSRGDVRIEVFAQGKGPAMVLLPSLGRGAEDFEPMARVLQEEGFRVLRPQPRGIGGSSAKPVYADLHDCSNDIAA